MGDLSGLITPEIRAIVTIFRNLSTESFGYTQGRRVYL